MNDRQQRDQTRQQFKDKIAEIPREELNERYYYLLMDWADDDNRIRELCYQVLDREYVDGDSHYVPSFVDLVEKLVDLIEFKK